MISLKAALAVSMTAVGASTLAFSTYVATHPPVSASLGAVETELGPLPRTRFEFVRASSLGVASSAATDEMMLDPVTIYGRTVATTKPAQRAVLQPCSAWRSLATGPADRRVKDLCLSAR